MHPIRVRSPEDILNEWRTVGPEHYGEDQGSRLTHHEMDCQADSQRSSIPALEAVCAALAKHLGNDYWEKAERFYGRDPKELVGVPLWAVDELATAWRVFKEDDSNAERLLKALGLSGSTVGQHGRLQRDALITERHHIALQIADVVRRYDGVSVSKAVAAVADHLASTAGDDAKSSRERTCWRAWGDYGEYALQRLRQGRTITPNDTA